MAQPHRLRLKVRHYEVDVYGHVNHAHYVHYLETGRIEALEAIGLSLDEMRRRGYSIFAADLFIKYHSPARLGDELDVLTHVRELRGARSIWVQEIREASTQRVVVTAKVTGAFMTEAGRPARAPVDFTEKLAAIHLADDCAGPTPDDDGARPVAAPGTRRDAASDDTTRDLVKQKYGQVALRVSSGETSCCGGTSLYQHGETAELPEAAVAASLGCGNPTALAQLTAGETVLDLGSGGGIDVLLSAKRVGPTGKAYGLDMTDEMLALARENQRKAGVTNVEFLKGEIEAIPLPDNSVDVIISNCVINLSADKDRVFAEAFRVLKPGGRFAVSDVVVRGEVPAAIRRSVELWIGCVAGALEEAEYRDRLAKAGFETIDMEPTRIYRTGDAREFLDREGVDAAAIAPVVDGKFMSAFIRARKPLTPEQIDQPAANRSGEAAPS